MTDHVRQIVLFTATDGTDNGVTSTGTFYSNVISLPKQSTVAIHLEWDLLTDTDTLWASDKPKPNEATDADWVQVTGVSITSPAGSASKVRYDLGNVGARWLRVKVVHGSGTGKRRGWATIKEG
jgi:hypothetical protein